MIKSARLQGTEDLFEKPIKALMQYQDASNKNMTPENEIIEIFLFVFTNLPTLSLIQSTMKTTA